MTRYDPNPFQSSTQTKSIWFVSLLSIYILDIYFNTLGQMLFDAKTYILDSFYLTKYEHILYFFQCIYIAIKLLENVKHDF